MFYRVDELNNKFGFNYRVMKSSKSHFYALYDGDRFVLRAELPIMSAYLLGALHTARLIVDGKSKHYKVKPSS